MTALIDALHIETENEKYGGFLDEDAPGIWMVKEYGSVRHLFTNRRAAQAYIASECEPAAATLEVWAVSETWPENEED